MLIVENVWIMIKLKLSKYVPDLDNIFKHKLSLIVQYF